MLFAAPGMLLSLVTLVVFVLQAFALIDAVTHRPDAYVAADKLTKQAWLIILGLAVVVHMVFWNPISILNLVGAVAAVVYLVDVRPALRSLTRRR
jgi:asparagine N-glycosylation enzyme membrane subunit Stt3